MSGILVSKLESFYFSKQKKKQLQVQLLEFIKTDGTDGKALHGGHRGGGIVES